MTKPFCMIHRGKYDPRFRAALVYVAVVKGGRGMKKLSAINSHQIAMDRKYLTN